MENTQKPLALSDEKIKSQDVQQNNQDLEEELFYFNHQIQDYNIQKCCDELNEVLNESKTNNIRLGKYCFKLIKAINKIQPCLDKELKLYVRYKNVGLKPTQIKKYAKAFEYCNKKFIEKQSTENYIPMGIEKIYILSIQRDKWLQNRLENLLINEDISVSQLKMLIEMINGKSRVFNIACEIRAEIEQNKLNDINKNK